MDDHVRGARLSFPSGHSSFAFQAAAFTVLYLQTKYCTTTQLPGTLFCQSEICKKLSHHFLLHFTYGMGSYDHHGKYQGVFPYLLENTFFLRVPLWRKKI